MRDPVPGIFVGACNDPGRAAEVDLARLRTTCAGPALIRTVRWIVSVIIATLICGLRISDEIREHPIPAGDVAPAVRNGDPMCCLGLTIRLEGAQFVVQSIRHPSLLHNDECQVVEANIGRSKDVPWFNQAC